MKPIDVLDIVSTLKKKKVVRPAGNMGLSPCGRCLIPPRVKDLFDEQAVRIIVDHTLAATSHNEKTLAVEEFLALIANAVDGWAHNEALLLTPLPGLDRAETLVVYAIWLMEKAAHPQMGIIAFQEKSPQIITW